MDSFFYVDLALQHTHNVAQRTTLKVQNRLLIIPLKESYDSQQACLEESCLEKSIGLYHITPLVSFSTIY